MLGAVAMVMQLLLSSNMVEWIAVAPCVVPRHWFIPWMSSLSGRSTRMACDKATYSASVDDSVVSDCSLEAQTTGHVAKVMTCPVRDFDDTGSRVSSLSYRPMKSAST